MEYLFCTEIWIGWQIIVENRRCSLNLVKWVFNGIYWKNACPSTVMCRDRNQPLIAWKVKDNWYNSRHTKWCTVRLLFLCGPPQNRPILKPWAVYSIDQKLRRRWEMAFRYIKFHKYSNVTENNLSNYRHMHHTQFYIYAYISYRTAKTVGLKEDTQDINRASAGHSNYSKKICAEKSAANTKTAC